MAAAMHPTEVWSKTQFDKENRLAPGQLELLNSLPGWDNLGMVRARSHVVVGVPRTNWHPRRTPRPTLETHLTTTMNPREPQAIPLDETPDASPTNSQDALETKAVLRPSQGDFLKRQKGRENEMVRKMQNKFASMEAKVIRIDKEKSLLEGHANVALAASDGTTPLHCASRFGAEDCDDSQVRADGE